MSGSIEQYLVVLYSICMVALYSVCWCCTVSVDIIQCLLVLYSVWWYVRQSGVCADVCHRPTVGRVSGDVVAAIVQKAIAAPKTSTRDKARELLLMVVEIEQYEIVQEELVKGFS